MERVIIMTGGSGRLGSELKKRFTRIRHPTEGVFDVTNPAGMYEYLEGKEVEAVIHCAAMTDVTHCEFNPLEAYCVNALGTYYLAEICDDLRIKMIYISTDHVFDGQKGNYSESDIPNPIGVYAKSKLMGEWFTLSNPKNLVIRTSFMSDFQFDKAYTDKYFSAEDVNTTSRMIARAINDGLTGLWHIAGDRKSVYNLAIRFKKDVGAMELKDRLFNDAGLAYLKDTSLDCSKWRKYDSEARQY